MSSTDRSLAKYDHKFKPRNAKERHEQFMHTLHRYGDNQQKIESLHSRRGKNDFDILRDHYKLKREDDDDDDNVDGNDSDEDIEYGKKLAMEYERELNKEYGIVDLKGYKKGKCGIRWRTKDEVLLGKGYRICGGNKCNVTMDRIQRNRDRDYHRDHHRKYKNDEDVVLRTFLVPFVYLEGEQYKHTNIKLRLCSECGDKLNYKAAKKQRKRDRKKRKERRKKKRDQRTDEMKKKKKSGSRSPSHSDIEKGDDDDRSRSRSRSPSRSQSRSRSR